MADCLARMEADHEQPLQHTSAEAFRDDDGHFEPAILPVRWGCWRRDRMNDLFDVELPHSIFLSTFPQI